MNHSHVLYDSDPHFKIEPKSRKIINESPIKTTIIQHDHNSERLTFEIPRYVEGHDLSECNIVEVHYMNIESNTRAVRNGVYTVDDLRVKDDDDETVVCSWLISDNATRFVGQLQFLIRFSCAKDDTGVIDYVWNTGIYSGMTVSTGIYNGDTSTDNRPPAFNFVTTIDGQVLKFFVGTQAEYDALSHEVKQNLFALISDDKSKQEIEKAFEELREDVEGCIEFCNENSMRRRVITSIEDLDNAINNYGTCSVIFDNDVTIASVTIPWYSRGIISSRKRDASLLVVDPMCNIYSSYRSNGAWGMVQKIQEKPTTATYLENGGHRFGRALIWSTNPLLITKDSEHIFTSAEKKLNIGKTLTNKRLIISIERYYEESNLLGLFSHATRFYTTPFTIIYEGATFEQSIDGVTFYFSTRGTNIYFKCSSTSKCYGISDIYEEI